MTPALQTQDAPWRAERPTVIARCTSPCQPQPFVVTTLRPLAVVACEALPAAHRLLADSAAGCAAGAWRTGS